jgi:ATP-binding cassette subfamily F protein 2
MVSASKAKREAERAAKRAATGDEKPKKTAASRSKAASAANSVAGSKASSVNGDDEVDLKLQKLKLQEDDSGISDRVTTGVLASLEASRDVKITSASLVFHGKVLFNDTTIEINFGRRYGLLGENGCGKSTLLKAMAAREFPIPDHVDIYLLNEPADVTNLSALDYVVKQAELELARLETMAEEMMERDGAESPELEHLYEVRFVVRISVVLC